MRIIFVSSGCLPSTVSDVELHAHQLAREFMNQGHQVLIFGRDYAPGKPEYAMERTTVHHSVPMIKLNNKLSECDSFDRLYDNPAVAKAFNEVLNEFKPDLVHIHHLSNLSTGIAKVVKENSIPMVMTLHDYWMGCPRTQRITASLSPCSRINLKKCLPCLRELWPSFFAGGKDQAPREEADGEDMGMLENYHAHIHSVLETMDCLIAPSRFTKNVLTRYGISKSRITVVRNGLEKEPFAEFSPVRSTMVRFGFVGPMVPSKGVHLLIEAFKLIGGSNLQLHIWGEAVPFYKDTNYGHRLAVLTKGWENSILFHGHYEHEDLPEILSRIDVLVVPSIWYETSVRSIMEGFQAGVPVIASNFGAMAEAIENEETGLLFSVGDSVDLSNKMRRLMGKKTLRKKLASFPKKVPSIGENVAALKKVYREVSGLSFD